MKARTHLTKAQSQLLQHEIDKQIAESLEEKGDNFDALILYALHKNFGFGKRRLRRFYTEYAKLYKELVEYYKLPDDEEWLAKTFLKMNLGIDIKEWRSDAGMNSPED